MAFTPTALTLPFYPFKLTQKLGQYYIFDEIRKKQILLTPEEWVRQHFIQFLINEKKFPKSLIQVEGGLVLNALQKRTDILVYNLKGEKLMIIECKAPNIKLNQDVFDQAARYNLVHKAPYLAITNGLSHYYASINHLEGKAIFMEELLPFHEL